MIVILTVINVILSCLLLVIPKIDDVSFMDKNKDSLLKIDSTQIVFCELCSFASKLKTMGENLTTFTDNLQDEIFCKQQNTVSKNFTGYCSKYSNSSFSPNFRLEIKIDTCYSIEEKSKSSRYIDMNYSEKRLSTIFIKLYQNSIFPEISIVCCKVKNLFEEQLNITENSFLNSCKKYSENEILSNNDKIEIYQDISNSTICNDLEVYANGKTLKTIKHWSFETFQFWIYTVLVLICSICSSAIFTLSDTACHESVHTTGADYGKQRAWGAIGWGLFSPLSGFLNDYTDNYWASMILVTLLCSLQILNLSKMNLIKPQFSQSIFKDIKTVLGSSEFIAFEVGVFLNGMGIGIVICLLAWFITDIGGSRLLIGLVQTVQCLLGEMPFMFFSGWIIRKIGHFNVVSMALLANSIRFLVYSLIKDPWWILPNECLDGITFGAFYAAMTSYGKINAKPGSEATTQSLLASTYGLGSGIAIIVVGSCMEYYGGYTAFFYSSIWFAGATAINITSTVLLSLKRRSAEITKEIPSKDIRY